ncbi:hypothetical protein ALC57_05980 [Trachymyrmex cornetzi]|uniref:Endonuclease/exonuclease/phosphatase domain-containing protein n=1 Tax=Trachymyrmex cornetzi TaxID=471704 RepID=A0A151J9D3_9HYME|nr:hypothetical protein ALC57_05980 [Trachymyrmex cornetzi]
MSETWLKPRVPDSLVSLRGYYLVKSDREGRGGGGRLHPSFSSAIIIGDFNIDLNRRSFDSDSLLDYSSSYHLFIIPFSDTHHTSSSSTRIDHCLISNRSLIKSFSQYSLSFLSMHDLIEVDIVNRFLCTARDTHVPLRSFRARRPPAPWLDQSVRALMRERDAARRQFRLHPSPASWSTFRLLRNQVSLQVDASTWQKCLSNGSSQFLLDSFATLVRVQVNGPFQTEILSPELRILA